MIPPDLDLRLRTFIDAQRVRCLWYLRKDYYPTSFEEATRILEAIQRHGDLEAFRQAGELKEWLSRISSGASTQELHPERSNVTEPVAPTGKVKERAQWARDSAFRFFPLVEHEDFGLTLHPFDLAATKVLALVGRLEPRDWIDVIHSHERIQPLGYIAWAACGKDPGLSPAFILSEARRTGRYTAVELASLEFAGPTPDPAALSRKWKELLQEADRILAILPAAEAGKCVLDREGGLFRGSDAELARAMGSGKIRFHAGSLGGSFPQVIPKLP